MNYNREREKASARERKSAAAAGVKKCKRDAKKESGASQRGESSGSPFLCEGVVVWWVLLLLLLLMPPRTNRWREGFDHKYGHLYGSDVRKGAALTTIEFCFICLCGPDISIVNFD